MNEKFDVYIAQKGRAGDLLKVPKKVDRTILKEKACTV